MSSIRQPYLDKARRVVLKVGSAVLTTPEGLNQPLIERLIAESFSPKVGEREFIIVSSGAVAAGCRKLGLSSRPTGIPQQQAVAAAGQSALTQAYEAAFARFGLKVAQILLTHDDLESRQRFLNARNTLFTLLQWQVVPIINENDTVATDELKFGDNDNLAALICNLVEADLLILLTDIDGLFDKDPREHPDAKLVPLVEFFDAKLEKAASGRAGTLGRGGMVSKLQAAKKAAAAGVPTIIANGLQPGILEEIFSGAEVGTFVLTGPAAQEPPILAGLQRHAQGGHPSGPGRLEGPGAGGQKPPSRGHPGSLRRLRQMLAGAAPGPRRQTLRHGPHQLLGPGHRPHQGPPDRGNRPIPGRQGLRRSHPPGQPGDLPGRGVRGSEGEDNANFGGGG